MKKIYKFLLWNNYSNNCTFKDSDGYFPYTIKKLARYKA